MTSLRRLYDGIAATSDPVPTLYAARCCSGNLYLGRDPAMKCGKCGEAPTNHVILDEATLAAAERAFPDPPPP